MSALHIVTLVVAVSVQGVFGFLNPAFTATFKSKVITIIAERPIAFNNILTNVGDIYTLHTGTVRIPLDGVYWVTLNARPSLPDLAIETALVMRINGKTTKLRSWIKGFQSSRSAGFKLKQGDQLTVIAEKQSVLASMTYWSVVYIGAGAQVFSAWVGQAREQQAQVPFPDFITTDNSSLMQDFSRLFTVRVSSLYLVHLSVNGDDNLALVLQAQLPSQSSWRELLVAGPVHSKVPSNGDAVFDFSHGTKLRVLRRDYWGIPISYPGAMTLFSIVSIGSTGYGTGRAFTGETRGRYADDRFYKKGRAVRFEHVSLNTNNDYNTATHTYTVPFDAVYIVSLRPYTANVGFTYDDEAPAEKCCLPLILDLYSATPSPQVKCSVYTEVGPASGVSLAFYFSAGEKLYVGASTTSDTAAYVHIGSLFSIGSLK